jgi:hypothetical protein
MDTKTIAKGSHTFIYVENGADSVAVGLRNQQLLVAMTSDGKIVNSETYENQLFLYKGGVVQELTKLDIQYYDTSAIVGYSNISTKVTNIAKGLFSVTLTEGYPILNDKALIKLTAKSTDCPDGVSIDFTIQGVRAGSDGTNGMDITVYELLPSTESDLYFSRNDDDSFVEEYQDIYCGYCKRTGSDVTNYPGNIKANLYHNTSEGGTAPYNIFYKYIAYDDTEYKYAWAKDLEKNGVGVLRISSDTTYKGVLFILANTSGISLISDDNIIDREEILFIKAPKKGEKGDDAIQYTIIPSTTSIRRKSNGQLETKTISFQYYYIKGNGSPVYNESADSESLFFIYSFNDSETSTTVQVNKEVQLDDSVTKIKCSLINTTGKVYATCTINILEDIQDDNIEEILQDVVAKQIDNQISIWFTDYEPTLENEPASEWTSPALQQEHIEDVCFDRSTGKAYSYSVDSDDNFSWQEITDAETLKALSNAATAQATADGKATIFLGNVPYVPYNKGDIWIADSNSVRSGATYGSGADAKVVSNGQVLISENSRSSKDSLNFGDWNDYLSDYYRDTDFINDVIGNATKGNNVFYFDSNFKLYTDVTFSSGNIPSLSGTEITEYSKGDVAVYIGTTDFNYTFGGVKYNVYATTVVGQDSSGNVKKNRNYPRFFCINSGTGSKISDNSWADWIADLSLKSRIDNEVMFQNALFDKYGHSIIEQTANKINMVVDDNGNVQSSFKMTADQINLSSTGSIALNDVLKVVGSNVLINGYLSIEFTDLDESVSNGSNTLYDLSNPTQGVLLKNTFQVKVDNSQYGYKPQDNYRNIKVILPYDKEYIGTRCIIWNNGGGRVTLPNNGALTGNVYAAEICEIVSQPLQSKVLIRKDEYYEDGVKYNEETYTEYASAYPIGNVYGESDMDIYTAESWFTSVYFQYGIIELLGVPVYLNVTRYYDYGTDDEKVETAKEIIGTQWVIINRRCAAFGTGTYVSYGDTNYPFKPTQWWENYNEE